MKRDKYMGLDVHQATTVVSVIDAEGKIVWETIVPTETGAILRLIESISGPIHVTFEETTQAEWLYDLLQGLVAEVVVCDPRRNKLLVAGSKGDKADARKLAELLRTECRASPAATSTGACRRGSPAVTRVRPFRASGLSLHRESVSVRSTCRSSREHRAG